MMLRDAGPELGPPAEHWKKWVEDYGHERFVDDLLRFVHTKYRSEAIYCLGYFGDEHHVKPIALALDDPDPRVRRVAMSSFSVLTGVEFEDPKKALRWWSKHKGDYPS